MNTPPPAYLELARRLLAAEAAGTPAEGTGGVTTPAFDRLRESLEKLVGAAGFQSLLSRALAVARARIPALGPVFVRPDGSLGGFEAVRPAVTAEAGVALMAELLGLLVTFVGETLALRIVRDAWPDAVEGGEDGETGDEHER